MSHDSWVFTAWVLALLMILVSFLSTRGGPRG